MSGFKPNDWGEDLGNLGLSAPRTKDQSGDAFEIGNLAALEDDPLSAKMRSVSPSPPGVDDSEPPPRVVSPQSLPQLSSLAPPDPYPAPKSKAGVWAVVAVLTLLAAGAGAYFGGLIPH
jgi:hypothetical protein